MFSPLRYPGGKSKHTGKILQFFTDHNMEYREPFVGGGSVFLASNFSKCTINDIHTGVYDLWWAIKENPEELVTLIDEHTPILDHRGCKNRITKAIELWKQVKGDQNHKLFSAGYRFLFLNRTCYSGVVTGGPVGGMKQKSNYPISCRWAAKRTIGSILKAHERLQDCHVTNNRWQDAIWGATETTAMYLDPPYLEKGAQCYEYSFTLKDHADFAAAIQDCPGHWVVTVDNCPPVRVLWKESDRYVVMEKEWKYSMTEKRNKNKVGKELFVVSRECYDSK